MDLSGWQHWATSPRVREAMEGYNGSVSVAPKCGTCITHNGFERLEALLTLHNHVQSPVSLHGQVLCPALICPVLSPNNIRS